ncbi:L-seryl-tRNA(Sec) selenium transferase [Pseudactinotalea sp. HY158]|nr:L-seryl-tRNA(Sec) selenium transferase [Pseudactinotalea sp. HY158]
MLPGCEGGTVPDPRRGIPRTDALLALPAARAAADRLGPNRVRTAVRASQEAARRGELAPEAVEADTLARIAGLESREASSLRPVLNATGVVVHTNLGRAPLSDAARAAVAAASGYTDLELDLRTGRRSRRGEGARAALLAACPAAGDALVVNNGAAALLLAVTALAAGRDVIISRGELVEIGGGFRLPELLTATGARLREVGTTNRTHARDYSGALGAETGCLLKVHPSNFTQAGFVTDVPLTELRGIASEGGVPLVADLGSGLLHPEPVLPGEPDVTSALAAGADLVIVSGDKLLGGPQAGILLGRVDLIDRLARHPLARALRADKLTLAALEATVIALTAMPGPAAATPVMSAVRADPQRLRDRAEALAAALPASLAATVVPHDGRVGGGGAPGVALQGWAVRLPERLARTLRANDPAVLARTHDGACLLDLRCIPEADDDVLQRVVRAALAAPEVLPAPAPDLPTGPSTELPHVPAGGEAR